MHLLDASLAGLGALIALRRAILVGGAVVHAAREGRAATGQPDDAQAPLPPLDVLVPAWNEATVLPATLAALCASDHPDFRVLVIDDGSTDATAEIAAATGDPRVRVLRQPTNQGKAAALNAGLAQTRGPHIVSVDADTLVAPDALRRLARRLAQADAVAGNVKVGNRRGLLGATQAVEYVAALHLDRRAQHTLGCITTIPGALGAARRDVLRATGGWSGRTRTEDTDLTLTLVRAGRRVVFAPDAVALTEAPATPGDLVRQRARWLHGYLQCLWHHRGGFFAPSTLGWFGLPSLLYVYLLAFLLPLPGWLGLTRAAEVVGPAETALAVLAAVGLDVVFAAWAVWVDRERASLVAWAPVQRLLWVPLAYAALALVITRALSGRAMPWWRAARAGSVPGPPTS